MDPSIMKLLEDDEDESMHSGADVEAFTAALNRDIGGDPSEPAAAGDFSQGNSSAPPGHWQSSTQDESLGQQSQHKEQNLHSQSLGQHSSQTDQIEQGSSAKNQDQPVSNQPEPDHQQLQAETSSLQFADKDQVKIPEQTPVQDPKFDRPQHSESQRQLNSQQAPSVNDANNEMRRMKSPPSIPFHMLIPILRPSLDRERSIQLQSVFTKLRNNQINKEDFLRIIKNIVGDQLLRQAAHKVQLQIQSQAARGAQTNPNQYSLQSQAASQQISSRGTQFTESQAFLPHSISSQNQKGHRSPPRQPHVLPSAVQMRNDTEFPNLESSGQRSLETENSSDGKGMHTAQMYSTNRQHHPQPPQTSFSMFGSTVGNFHGHAYPRPSVTASTSLKSDAQSSQMRQGSQTQPMNIMNVPKSVSQKNSLAWQPLANKEHNNALQSLPYVKQEVVENAVETSQKFQFSAAEGSSFGSGHIEQGNPTLGALKDERLEKQSSRMGFSKSSITGTNQVSGAMSSQVETPIQMPPHISSATQPLVAGTPARTPPKKPSIGQKKPLEIVGTSSPLSSKKQKTSGAFLDQSIEQLNDVTAVSGVNLREEEEQLLSAPKEESRASEATRRVVREEEERLILQKGPLQKKLSDIMSKCGLENIGSDVERCLSLCAEERLRGLISYVIRLSKQRVDIEKTRHRFVVTSDVRSQILQMNRKAKEEWDKKQAEEAEKLRKLNESEGNPGAEAEKDKDEGRSKTIKANKEEDDKMRTTAANVAARAAVGGDDMLSKWQLMAEQARQKRDGVDVGPTSQPSKATSRKTMPTFGRGLRQQQEAEKRGAPSSSINGGMRKAGRNQAMAAQARVPCSVSVKDVISVLEREPQMSKSTLIYRLYERMAGDPAPE